MAIAGTSPGPSSSQRGPAARRSLRGRIARRSLRRAPRQVGTRSAEVSVFCDTLTSAVAFAGAPSSARAFGLGELLADHPVEHLRAGLGTLADGGGEMDAGSASVGLAAAEPDHVAERLGCGGDRLRRLDARGSRAPTPSGRRTAAARARQQARKPFAAGTSWSCPLFFLPPLNPHVRCSGAG